MSILNIPRISTEESSERLKIVLPIKRQWGYLCIYSLLLLSWFAMFVYGFIYTWQTAVSGTRFATVFTFLLLGLLFILYRLGHIIWRQWQYYAANREILFLFEDHMVLRRPLSLWGITTAYDRAHIRPFYYHPERQTATFDYGSLYVPFAAALSRAEAESLIQFLNGRYFPNLDDDED